LGHPRLRSNQYFFITAAPVTYVILQVLLFNWECVSSIYTCNPNLSQVPLQVHHMHIMLGLALHSLVSVVKFCNTGYEVQFTEIGCFITFCDKVIICGKNAPKRDYG